MKTEDFAALWPQLTEQTRAWLVDHHGEPLDAAVRAELTQTSRGATPPTWLDPEGEDGPVLTDETVDWVEAVANGE